MNETEIASERPVGLVRGTSDRLPDDHARLTRLEAILVERFRRAGYAPMSIPVLEFTDLHERKSGAGIVSKLYELSEDQPNRVCLRPELTAGVVRAFAEANEPPPLPWRVCVSGPVFRHEAMRPGFDREFRQVGVEMLGSSGPDADAEILWLASWALQACGIADATIRVGHVGLILEVLERSGIPEAARAAMVERLSEAAADGRNVGALESALDQLAGWLGANRDGSEVQPLDVAEQGAGTDRLFRTLVPDVTGRRSGGEILGRLRRKWELGHTLHSALDRLRERIGELASLRGPALSVLERLEASYATLAPESVKSLRELVRTLGHYEVDLDRVELDLGFGRGIGFYSRVVFELIVPTPNGPVEVCGGGRYDGLARVFGSNRDDRGAGFAFGLERLDSALEARGPRDQTSLPSDGFLVLAGDSESVAQAIRLASALRARSGRVVLETKPTFADAREFARQAGLRRVVSVGPSRSESAEIQVEDLLSGQRVGMTGRALLDLLPGPASGERPS